MDEKRYVLAFCESFADEWYRNRISRMKEDPAEKRLLSDQFNRFMHFTNTDNQFAGMSYDDFIREVSGANSTYTIGRAVFNTNKKFRHIKFITRAIEILEDCIKITQYQFTRNSKIVISSRSISRKSFSTNFVYMTHFNRDVQLFESREEAMQYGMSFDVDNFTVYVFNMVDSVGTKDIETNEVACDVSNRIKTASLENLYEILMEYIGAEIDIYDRDGSLVYAVWTNAAMKSYKDFEDLETCIEIKNWARPLQWSH